MSGDPDRKMICGRSISFYTRGSQICVHPQQTVGYVIVCRSGEVQQGIVGWMQ